MNNMCIWNVRGLNSPRKQKEIVKTVLLNKVAICGLVEMKIKTKNFPLIYQNMFSDWNLCTNFSCHKGSRILIAWRPKIYEVTPIVVNAQLMHCVVRHIPSKAS